MDELFFRCSQKLENVQIQLNIFANEGRTALQRQLDVGRSFFSEMLHGDRLEFLRGNARDAWLFLVSRTGDVHQKLLRVPRELYDNFITALGKQWTKQNLSMGCLGFVVGGIMGIAVVNGFCP